MPRRPLAPEVSAACLAGHFPGRPVVPGVVLIRAALDATGLRPPLQISQAKFLRPCTAQMALTVAWQEQGGRIRLRIEHEGEAVALVTVQRPAANDGGDDGEGDDDAGG